MSYREDQVLGHGLGAESTCRRRHLRADPASAAEEETNRPSSHVETVAEDQHRPIINQLIVWQLCLFTAQVENLVG